MNGRTTAVLVAGLAALGIFAIDVAARSQSAPADHWVLASGSANEAWKMNTRTGEVYYCIPAQAHPKVVCAK